MTGAGVVITLIGTVAELTQPLASVPETVYVVEFVTVVITVAPVVVFKPVEGDHVYVEAPEADNDAELAVEQ